MKALSIQQPFASLIADGYKTIETRTWQTKYRGDILICAGKQLHSIMNCSTVFKLDKYHAWQYKFNLKEYLEKKFIYGQAICIAELYNITRYLENMEDAAKCFHICSLYAWHLRNIRKIEPFPVKGKLRLFEVDYDIEWVEDRFKDVFKELAK